MGEIVTVNFRGDELYGFKQDDGIFVALKPLVEGMGMSWQGQHDRVHRDPVLSKGIRVIRIPFGRGGAQEALCLKLDRLNGWLFGIDSARIKDEAVRERVILYQEECCDVLYDHFSGKSRMKAIGEGEEPAPTKSDSEKLAHVREVRQTFNTQAAREIYFLHGLPVTPSMLQAEQGNLFSYTAIRRETAEAA